MRHTHSLKKTSNTHTYSAKADLEPNLTKEKREIETYMCKHLTKNIFNNLCIKQMKKNVESI